MAAPVTLLVRKFLDGSKAYKASLRPSIEVHPERDRIVETIEAEGINYKSGTKKRQRQ